MSSKRSAVFLAALAALALGVGRSSAQPEQYGFPERLTDLTWLGPIEERKDLDSLEKTEVLVTWLIREQRDPSPTRQGLGGAITSGYIQAQIITALFTQGDPLPLLEIASDAEAELAVKDAARISLGLMGDVGQIPDLIRILQDSPEGFYRAKAAEALGLLGASEAVPALRAALDDDFSVPGGSSISEENLAYPVRQYATESLRRLGAPESAAAAEARTRAFAERFQQMNRSLVDLRGCLGQRGWSIVWDNTTKRATAANRRRNLEVVFAEGSALLNGRSVKLAAAPVLARGHFLVPRSFGVAIAYKAMPLSLLARASRPSDVL
jgi:hypothetical protein